MTFIFFAGISVVLVPIGLGAAGLAQFFRDFHKELWIFGGAFMLFLAIYSVLGKGISLPFVGNLKARMGGEQHGKSVFVLGVLSGAATSCCAPVLAGAMTLAVLSGGFWNALIVTFAYVFGMVFPLFLTAYFYDKFKIEQSKLIQGKLIRLPIGERGVMVHTTNLLAAAMFALIGGTMLFLGLSGNAFYSPEHQAELGGNLTTWSTKLLTTLSVVPEWVWGTIIIGTFIFLLYELKRRRNKRNNERDNGNKTDNCCH